MIAQWIGLSVFSFMLYTAAGTAHRYALSKLEPSLILQLEITFINLFMAIGLIMLLKGLLDGTFRQGYDAPDLPFLMKAPIPPYMLFAYRVMRVIWANLFGLIFWLLPPWLATARVFRPNVDFFLSLLPTLFLLLLVAEGAVALIALPFVYLIYSRRAIRLIGRVASVLFIMALGFLMASYAVMTPTARERVFEWLSGHTGPLVSRGWYPHVWASNLLMHMLGLEVKGTPWRWMAYLISSAIGLIGLAVGISEKLYYPGWERSKTVEVSLAKRRFNLRSDLQLLFRGPVRAIIFKDLTQTVREPRYWPMLIILLLLPAVSLITLVERDMALMNGLTMLCVQQLVYGTMLNLSLCWASFKLEGKAWWILRSSPLTAQKLFNSKFAMASVVAVIYVELFVIIGLAMLRVPLGWYPMVILPVGLAMATFASLNTAISSLPSVALTEEKRFTSALTSAMTMFLSIGMTTGSVATIAVVQEGYRSALPWVSIGLLSLFLVILSISLRLGLRNTGRLIEPQG
jgi:hypothetical protein